jgi:hypothetical protein
MLICCLASSGGYILQHIMGKLKHFGSIISQLEHQNGRTDQRTIFDVARRLGELIRDLYDIKTGEAGQWSNKDLQPPSLNNEFLRHSNVVALSPRDNITHAYMIYVTMCNSLYSWTVHNSNTITTYFEAFANDPSRPVYGNASAAYRISPKSLSSSRKQRTIIDQQSKPAIFQMDLFSKPGEPALNIQVLLVMSD